MLHKTNGRTKNSFKARFRTYKVYFYCGKNKEEKAVDRASLNTKHSVSEPINNENTDLKSGSDGIETEHLEGEGLVQSGVKKYGNLPAGCRGALVIRIACRAGVPGSITPGVTSLKVL